MKKVVLAFVVIGVVAVAPCYAPWAQHITPGNTYNQNKETWTDCEDGPGRWQKWGKESGESGIHIELWAEYGDDDAVQPLVSWTNQWRRTWTWVEEKADGLTPADFTFMFNLKGKAYSKAALSVRNDEGWGLVETRGESEVTGDTGNSSPLSEEKEVATGAQVILEEGGLTGIGIGRDSVSISWQLPDNGYWNPSKSGIAYPDVADDVNNPGYSAFIQVDTSASGHAAMYNGTYGSESSPSAESLGYGQKYTPWSGTMHYN